jgi:hypothetical protein
VVEGYYESEVMWKLHLLLKEALLGYGFEVLTTRDDIAKNVDVYDRGTMSKWCDLFVSLHSNSVTGSPSTQRIVVIEPINGKGQKVAKLIGDAVGKAMALKGNFYLQTTTKKTTNNRDYYGVIRGATDVGTIGLIIEHSFHTNEEACKWLLNKDNLKKLAEAEAGAIAEYFDVTKEVDEEVLDYHILKKGTLVSIKDGAVYHNGATVPAWILKENWYVAKDATSARVVIDKNEDSTRSINSAIDVKYLKLAEKKVEEEKPVEVPKKTEVEIQAEDVSVETVQSSGSSTLQMLLEGIKKILQTIIELLK